MHVVYMHTHSNYHFFRFVAPVIFLYKKSYSATGVLFFMFAFKVFRLMCCSRDLLFFLSYSLFTFPVCFLIVHSEKSQSKKETQHERRKRTFSFFPSRLFCFEGTKKIIDLVHSFLFSHIPKKNCMFELYHTAYLSPFFIAFCTLRRALHFFLSLIFRYEIFSLLASLQKICEKEYSRE